MDLLCASLAFLSDIKFYHAMENVASGRAILCRKERTNRRESPKEQRQPFGGAGGKRKILSV